MRRITSRPRVLDQNGFTLIEMLVVLIIAALISGILFQALERAYRLQARFGTELFRVQQGQMAVGWYRQTLQGLYPDQPDGRHVFRGTDHEISGLSNNPLGDNYGAPTPVGWRIRNNRQQGATELIYTEQNQETVVLSWRGEEGRFVYIDEKFNSHESWPPPLGQFPQLPSQIQLQTPNTDDPVNLVSSVRGPTTPLPRLTDLFGIKP